MCLFLIDHFCVILFYIIFTKHFNFYYFILPRITEEDSKLNLSYGP